MDWTQRLKSLVVDDNQRGRIRLKLIGIDAESRRMLFDDNDAAVQASLLALMEPAAAEEPPWKKRKSLPEAADALRQVLKERCPDEKFRDEDIYKLVAAVSKEFVQPAGGLRPADAAELPSARDQLQRFVRSAAQNYQEWERGKKKRTKPGDLHVIKPNKFLEVDGDPFGSFNDRFLIFIRKSYEDLKKIFMEAGEGQRYIVLGTAGIGKSLFTVFWICYLATLKKKVVWKFANDNYYLLDFSLEVAVARGPVKDETHRDLRSVLYDRLSWLIIDGKQENPLEYDCRMLLACSAKEGNHHEFSKHGKSKTYYLPVWAEAEIIKFCDDFEERRTEFSGMHVPDKQTALTNFKDLGGVPRYVLEMHKTQQGIDKFENAVAKVDAKNCLQILGAVFITDMSDRLIHMFVNKESHVDKETDYTRYQLEFASLRARDRIIEQFDKVGHLEVVGFMGEHINSQMFGSLWGQLYERVAHGILIRGGNFKKKKVFAGKAADGATKNFNQRKLKFVKFEKVEDLSTLKRGKTSNAYCQPSSLNFQSVDAVILPDTSVQFFRYSEGNRGYKIPGLKVLDTALKMDNYEVWSCVPKETFETTTFQNWLNKDGTICKLKDPETRALMGKMQQYVVEVDFRKY